MTLLRLLLSPHGRINRTTFIVYMYVLLPIMVAMVETRFEPGGFESWVLRLAILYSLLLVHIKRWHDRNKPGALIAINLFCCVGWAWSLYELTLGQGSAEANAYGAAPSPGFSIGDAAGADPTARRWGSLRFSQAARHRAAGELFRRWGAGSREGGGLSPDLACVIGAMAKLAKVDRAVSPEEIDYCRKFFLAAFEGDIQGVELCIKQFRTEKDSDASFQDLVRDFCAQSESREDWQFVFELLFGLALCDGPVDPLEEACLRDAHGQLGITRPDFDSYLKHAKNAGEQGSTSLPQPVYFAVAMFAKIAKVDGTVSQKEQAVVEKLFKEVFRLNQAQREAAVACFRAEQASAMTIQEYAKRVADMFSHEPDFLNSILLMLVQISLADDDFTKEEEALIDEVLHIFQIESKEYAQFKQMRASMPKKKGAEEYAEVLGISPTPTKAELTKAYRSLAMKYHPDKVLHLSDSLREVAEEEMKRINEAYQYFSNRGKGE